MVAFSLFCLIPLLLVVSISLSKESDIVNKGYALIPASISTSGYEFIFQSPGKIINAYAMTIIVTVVGTVIGILLTTMVAYALSRRDYRYRRITMFYLYFTTLFSGGIVPWYILIARYLKMKDTILVLIIPSLIAVWFIILMKGFLSSLPMSLFESANIDGASEFKIFFKIVLPLAKPGLATISLFYALKYWNDWWLPMLFINKESLVTLQYLLYKIIESLNFVTIFSKSGFIDINLAELPSGSSRMAMCVVAAGPMLIVFPFLQKYFIKGIVVGSLKD